MILVDTSIWIDHLHHGEKEMVNLLNTDNLLMHPFVLGELACGNLHNREDTLNLLSQLPQAIAAGHDEVLITIEQRGLMGQGIGYVDAHLITSSLLSNAKLWTRDRRLRKTADELKMAYSH